MERVKMHWPVLGSVFGAFLVSSCCVLPLALVMLGVSGAWIGNLAMLTPYKPYFTMVALAFLGFGFYRVYWRGQSTCADDAYCARPLSLKVMKALLSASVLLIALALTTDWWAPLFY